MTILQDLPPATKYFCGLVLKVRVVIRPFSQIIIAALSASLPTSSGAAENINKIADIPRYLQQCWMKTPVRPDSPSGKTTVLMSFKRSGEILGKPRVTFQSEGSDQSRLEIRQAAVLALMRCTPLPLAEELGSAVAGRLFRMTFEVQRGTAI